MIVLHLPLLVFKYFLNVFEEDLLLHLELLGLDFLLGEDGSLSQQCLGSFKFFAFKVRQLVFLSLAGHYNLLQRCLNFLELLIISLDHGYQIRLYASHRTLQHLL